MGWLSLLFFVVGLAAFYVFYIRPQLQKRPLLTEFYQHTNSFWAAIWLKLGGLKTKFSAWFIMVGSALVELHDNVLPFVTGVDWPSIIDAVPPWVWPLLGISLSLLFVWLNKITKEKQEREISATAVGVSAADADIIAATTNTPTEAAMTAVEAKTAKAM